MLYNRFFFILSALFLISCSSVKTPSNINASKQQTVAERNQQLSAINQFQLRGRIAFIQEKNRESASLTWSYNNKTKQQQLDLTTYLGINVLHLKNEGEIYTVKVGKDEYKTKDLTQLIYQRTGITLPTEALRFWIKGLSYQDQDQMIFHQTTNLPISLTSRYDKKSWRITYNNYQVVDNHFLPKKLTIRQSGLTIIIMINQWTLS